MNGFPKPSQLLQRIAEAPSFPLAIALCPDFELGSWRYKALAEHLFDWLPDVALKPRERLALLYEPNKQLAASCRRLFDTTDPSARGEIGEILLHAICRQEFETVPFVARLFYKMRSNDSVTSVDVVHVLENADSGDLELWLEEAKLYGSLDSAKYKALDSIKPLWNSDFLTEMKALIGPKIDETSHLSDKLTWLFSSETSLDQIIKRIVVPICIAADYPMTCKATARSDEYVLSLTAQLEELRSYYKARVPANISFVCIFVPLDCKEKLELAVNARVQSYLA